MSANSRIRLGLQIVFVCLYITPSHYHHCANYSEDIELIKCRSDIFCRVCKIKRIFSVIQYTICGAVCFQFTHFPLDDWENISAFYPRPVLAFGYCHRLRLCVCVRVWVCQSVCQSLACPRDNSGPLKLGSPNLDQMCKRPWLRSLLFLGVIDHDLQGQIKLQSQTLPHFWACPCDNSSPVRARTTKFRPEVQNTLVEIAIVLGVDWAWHVKFNLFSKSCLFASLLRLCNIGETCITFEKRSLFPILNGCAQICSPTGSCHGQWNSRVVSLVWPLLASQSSTRRLAMDL